MKLLSLYLRIVCLTLFAWATLPSLSAQPLRSQQSVTDPATLYQTHQYKELISIYKEQLRRGAISADLYYNMGNCYYQSDSIGLAILCYERALYHNPTDKATRHNLNLAQKKTVGIGHPRQSGIETWLDSLCYAWPVSTLSILAIVCFGIVVCLAILFLYSPNRRVKQYAFYSAIVGIIGVLIFNAMAFHQVYYRSQAEQEAIVLAVETPLLPTPNQEQDATTTKTIAPTKLYEGDKVRVTGSEEGYTEVTTFDGHKGWLPTKAIESIIPQSH